MGGDTKFRPKIVQKKSAGRKEKSAALGGTLGLEGGTLILEGGTLIFPTYVPYGHVDFQPSCQGLEMVIKHNLSAYNY